MAGLKTRRTKPGGAPSLDGDLHHHDPAFRFCPLCGGPLEARSLRRGEPERQVCGSCGFVVFLDPKVVACAIVERGGRIALLKRSMEPQKGRWVMPGGYVDRGETVASAAVRETLEECGLRVEIKGLLGVYSYPEKMAVVIVYEAACGPGDLTPSEESLEACWFAPGEIPWDLLAFQSTTDALKDYCRKTAAERHSAGRFNTSRRGKATWT